MKPHPFAAATFTACLCCATALLFTPAHASPIPDFEATALTGERVQSKALIGQPTILIVTPSRAAADETRDWAEALPKHIDLKQWRVRAVLAIDLPFFMDEQDVLPAARKKVPERYYDQTWLTGRPKLEQALGIPTNSQQAFVLVLDETGEPVVQVSGAPTARRLRAIESAAKSVLEPR